MRLFALFASASVIVALAVACSADNNSCASGTACTPCNDNSSCTRSCSGTSCSFQCNGNGSCTFDCPQGGCTATNMGNGSMELTCAGGGCTVNCEGNGSCSIADCPTCACNKPITSTSSCGHI